MELKESSHAALGYAGDQELLNGRITKSFLLTKAPLSGGI
jgi:hypothetical protein